MKVISKREIILNLGDTEPKTEEEKEFADYMNSLPPNRKVRVTIEELEP